MTSTSSTSSPPADSVYRCRRDADGTPHVTVDGSALDLTPFLPDSGRCPLLYDWGSRGRGCDNLAFALILHATSGDHWTTLAAWQMYRDHVVGVAPWTTWTTTRAAIIQWIADTRERVMSVGAARIGGAP